MSRNRVRSAAYRARRWILKTARRTRRAMKTRSCAAGEHEWELREDYDGDGSVPNGLRKLVWLECSICGATKKPEAECL